MLVSFCAYSITIVSISGFTLIRLFFAIFFSLFTDGSGMSISFFMVQIYRIYIHKANLFKKTFPPDFYFQNIYCYICNRTTLQEGNPHSVKHALARYQGIEPGFYFKIYFFGLKIVFTFGA